MPRSWTASLWDWAMTAIAQNPAEIASRGTFSKTSLAAPVRGFNDVAEAITRAGSDSMGELRRSKSFGGQLTDPVQENRWRGQKSSNKKTNGSVTSVCLASR